MTAGAVNLAAVAGEHSTATIGNGTVLTNFNCSTFTVGGTTLSSGGNGTLTIGPNGYFNSSGVISCPATGVINVAGGYLAALNIFFASTEASPPHFQFFSSGIVDLYGRLNAVNVDATGEFGQFPTIGANRTLFLPGSVVSIGDTTSTGVFSVVGGGSSQCLQVSLASGGKTASAGTLAVDGQFSQFFDEGTMDVGADNKGNVSVTNGGSLTVSNDLRLGTDSVALASKRFVLRHGDRHRG